MSKPSDGSRTPHGAEPPDEELVRLAAQGDSDAFGRLVERYQGRVFNLLGRMVGRRDVVEDLAQEVFIKAFRKIASFREESSFYTWLYAIALNTCRNHYRRQEPLAQAVDVDDHPDEVEKRAPAQAPDELAWRRQRAERVRAAVDRLPHDQREALVLCDLEGLGYQEIADLVGVPVGTVRSRIFRGRNNLRGLLDGELEKEDRS